jgi:hypothetical protein
MSVRKKCPHCNDVIDHVDYKVRVAGRQFGVAYISEDGYTDFESSDDELYTDEDTYQFYCPECEEEIERYEDLLPYVEGEEEAVPEPAEASTFDYQWRDGMRVVVDFAAHKNVLCEVCVERGTVFLLQNAQSGSTPSTGRRGYAYGWCVGNGSQNDCICNQTRNIRNLENNPLAMQQVLASRDIWEV